MAIRKTSSVKDMLDYANTQLKRTDEIATKDFKTGICVMIEKILTTTGNYSGFYHLDGNDCEINTIGYYSRFYL